MKVEPLTPNPYVGPKAFQQSETSIFMGRQRETREVVDKIFVNRAVVIYGKSGTGKTSLVHAGIIPQLTKEGFEVLPARVKTPIPPNVKIDQIQNLFAFNCIRQFAGEQADGRHFSNKTLAAHFKERQHPVDALGQPLMRAFILDQVHEMLGDPEQYWEHREPFFQQIHDALKQDHLLRVVFVIREEAFGSLESYSGLSHLRPHSRFRLQRMRKENALSALVEPLNETGLSFEPAAAEKLVDELLKIRIKTSSGDFATITGEFIEPVQLQVVAQKLRESLPKDKKVITLQDVESSLNVEKTLSAFYDRAIREIVSKSAIDESKVRDWFECGLISSSETRTMVLEGREETGGLPNRVVEQLVNKHLVRGVVHAEARWYELAHDGFIQPILQSNLKYRSST